MAWRVMAAPSSPQVPATFSHVCRHVGKPVAHDQTAEDVHGSRAKAPEEDKGKAVRSVLNEIADVFKGGEGEGNRDGGSLDFIALRLKHQQIEHQRQQLHDFLHYRRNLRRGGKGVRPAYRRKEGVDIGRKQTHPPSRRCKTGRSVAAACPCIKQQPAGEIPCR